MTNFLDLCDGIIPDIQRSQLRLRGIVSPRSLLGEGQTDI